MKFTRQIIHTFVKLSLLFLLVEGGSAYAQEIRRVVITHNGGADYSLGHLFLFNGSNQYVTDYSATISTGSNDFIFNYDVVKKKDGHGHIENLVRSGDQQNQKYWDASNYTGPEWWSSGTSNSGRYVEIDFGVGGQPVTDVILTAWVKYDYSFANRIYNQTITVYDGSDNLIQTYNLSNASYSDSGKYIFHITTDESDSAINSVINSLDDTSWTSGDRTKDVYKLADLTPEPDTTAPTISSVSSDKAVGSYKAGEVIDIDVVFDEAVTVTGTPQITLETGSTDQVVNYSSGSGGTTLTFNYTVQAGDTAADLDYASTTALALNSGTIKDAAANNATLTLPTVGGSNSLAGNEALVIDTSAPTNQNTVFASAVSDEGGDTITIVSSGIASNAVWFAPAGTTSFSASGTMTTAASGTATSIAAPATAGTYYLYVLDAAGNISSASSAALTVDNTVPTITGTTIAADNSTIAVTFGEAVFNTTGGSGALEASDFTLSLSGGSATLASATPSSISISDNVYTLGLNLSGTANGSETITVVPSSSTAIYDGADNAVSTSQSNNTVSLNSEDSTAPTMTITASQVSDGTASDDASLTMTFTSSEATTDFAVGDIAVSNATLSSFSATSSTVYTAVLTPTAQGAIAVNVAAGKFNDAAGNDNTAATEFNWTYLSSPLNKTDVTASVKAMSGVAIDAVKMNFNAVESRIAWVNSNVGSNKLSHQGIRLEFANPTVNKLMNTAYVKPSEFNPTNEFLELMRNNIKDGEAPEMLSMTEDTKQGLTNVAYNEFAKVREGTLDKVLNATGGAVMGDWNVWTEGRITVGKTYKTDVSSAQDSQTQNLSLGFDRIIKDDNQSSKSTGHIVGVVLGIGKSDADTTNNSTVDADSYSLSAYGVIRQNDKALAQAMVGYGHISVDKKRIDGSDTLNGSHDANQFFTSIKVQKETMSVGSFSLSPYGKIHASRTWYDGYSETGGATALTYGEQTIDSTVLSAGLDVDYLIPINKGNIRPFMQFEYGADVSGSSTVNMHYNNEVTNYQLQLDNKADSNWKFVLGTDMYTKDEWDSSISYERTEAVNAGYSNSLAVKVGLRF